MLMNVWLRVAALAALLPLLVTAPTPAQAPAASSTVRTERLATLEFPWALAALPDGRLLITEKPGRLRIFANGQLSPPVENVPRVVYRGGMFEQGGLLDVAVDPQFAQNRFIYLSYVEAADPQPANAADTVDPRFGGFGDPKDNIQRGGAVARATLDGNRLGNVQVIWRQVPKTIGRGHFGHRLAFGRDGTLFITSGDRMRFDPAQAMDSNLGKIVRINTDGSIPRDNPFATRQGARQDVYSVGHRNALAAAVHPTSGQLWVWEMGPLGGDELNVIQAGRNYGWPVVSNGDNYNKSPIPDHPTRPEFVAPVRTWTPVIAPSGALFYGGTLFPWRGSALVGGLSSQAIIRLTVDGTRVTSEERIPMAKRIRDLIEASDGSILVVTDDRAGELLRVRPAAAR
jgi:glucose/arabinose dehydrogenase